MMTSTTIVTGETARQSAIVTFLLDRSYSMKMIKPATLEGFNGYLAGLQQEADADIDFTLLTFDDQSVDKIHVAVPVKEARFLTEETYQPRGGTPLVEAAIQTIMAVEEALKRRTDKPRVTICIQTDGEENSSGAEYTTAALKALVEEKQKEGWEFNFLGSGIDVYATGRQYGFAASNTMSYDSRDIGATRSAFKSTAVNSASFSAGRVSSTAYSTADRKASGDRFWGDPAVADNAGAVVAPPNTNRTPTPAVPTGRGSRLKPIKL